jgi:hypothetical protein
MGVLCMMLSSSSLLTSQSRTLSTIRADIEIDLVDFVVTERNAVRVEPFITAIAAYHNPSIVVVAFADAIETIVRN